MTSSQPIVIFCTDTQSIIDYVYDGRGETPDQAIKRLAPGYGTALTPLPAGEAQDRYEARFKTPVREITQQEFDYALNCLPPVAWTHARAAESFKISEKIAGRVTSIYVTMRGRSFRFDDDIRTPHDVCCERVAAFIAANPTPSPTPEGLA